MTVGGAVTALAALVLHYTEKGNDPYGCHSERLMMAGKMNTNKYCTREVAACSYQPKYIPRADRGNANLACNETVSTRNHIGDVLANIAKIVVKWLQIILIVNALVVLALFSVQARIRRSTRQTRMKEPLPEPM
jgi:Flp pilus assembly protein TadB